MIGAHNRDDGDLPALAPLAEITGPVSHSFISQRLRLHYVDWGNQDAPILLLVHGGRDHCRSWDWVAQELRHDWHVIAPDLRGHGDSQWSPEGNYETRSFIYDLAQLIHQLNVEQVVIVAHSLGGIISTRFAGLFPEKVSKLVSIEGLGLPPETVTQRQLIPVADRWREWIDRKRAAASRQPRRYPTLESAFARMKEENAYLNDQQARHLTIHGASRNEDGTWSWKFDNYLHAWTFDDVAQDEIDSLWSSICCPTLLLCGNDSKASNPRLDGRASRFRNARVLDFDDAGHWLHHDQFQRFITELNAFLAE